MPEVLRRFLALHPKVVITVRQAPPDDVIQAVEDGQADIGLTFTRFGRQSVRLAGDVPAPFGAVVPKGHPLAGKKSIALERCLAYPMVKHYDPDGRHLFLDEIARQETLNVDAAVHTNSMVLAKSVIVQGHAIGIYIKYSLIREIASGEIAFVPLTHPSLAAHRIGIYIPANRHINSIERKLTEIAVAVLAEHG
jgi:DNA-binding transcriptional LysR family regulator